MPNTYRTTDEIIAQRLHDGKNLHLSLQDMRLFATGTFSNVYRGIARTESNNQIDIVIKKTWLRPKACPLEIKILGKLAKLKHKNIVRLLYSYQNQHNGRVCLALIFEFIPLNLYQYLKENQRQLDIIEVKLITWQLFRGQAHLERAEICHRDIKPQNLLYNAETGLLKISDFGSSTIQSSKAALHSYHVTRYYRPPELILGAKNYGCKIDVWSCGCVLGELLKGGIFLAGKSANNQAEVIFDMLGVPSAEELSAMKVNNVKFEELMQGYESDPTRSTFNFTYLHGPTSSHQKERKTAVFNVSLQQDEMKESADMLRQVLVYNPSKRLSGRSFLTNPYFSVLFNEKTIRSNGRKITCLSSLDLQYVDEEDITFTCESIDSEF